MADAPKTEAPVLTPAQIELRRLITKAQTSNPAAVEFPADIWGFTTALKKELLKAASGVRGQEDKQTLLVNVLTVALAHVKARYEPDQEARTAYAQRLRDLEAGRAHLERTTGQNAQAHNVSNS